MAQAISRLFDAPLTRQRDNLSMRRSDSQARNQDQTNAVFSGKWEALKTAPAMHRAHDFQKNWFLTLYGFADEAALKDFLAKTSVILDAGCGTGYKSAWFARLAPHATVIGMDFSTSVETAAETYGDLPNLHFVRGDIADTGLHQASVDFLCCDQVIMHTEDPDRAFLHLAERLSDRGEFACYIYARKALPRELLDDHFRSATHAIPQERLWQMSAQLTELGERLSALDIEFDAPDIPELGIEGGRYDIQRFIYWNFLKCFWNPELGEEISTATNFDWYAPSNAKRYTRQQFEDLIARAGLRATHFHEEKACFSGRFARR